MTMQYVRASSALIVAIALGACGSGARLTPSAVPPGAAGGAGVGMGAERKTPETSPRFVEIKTTSGATDNTATDGAGGEWYGTVATRPIIRLDERSYRRDRFNFSYGVPETFALDQYRGLMWFTFQSNASTGGFGYIDLLSRKTTRYNLKYAVPTYGLVAGRNKSMYLTYYNTQFGHGKLGRFDIKAKTIHSIDLGEGNYLQRIIVGPDGALWGLIYPFSGPYSLLRFDPATRKTTKYSIRDNARDLTTGPDGALWFTLPEGVLGRFDLTTHERKYIKIGHIDLWGIVRRDADLWFVISLHYYPYGQDYIGKYTPTTNALSKYRAPQQGVMLNGMTLGSDNELWVTQLSQDFPGFLKVCPTGC